MLSMLLLLVVVVVVMVVVVGDAHNLDLTTTVLNGMRCYSPCGFSMILVPECFDCDGLCACSATPAQVVLKWGIQCGCSTVPKSNSLARLKVRMHR